MDAFNFSLSAVLPIILTAALGYGLKRAGLASEDFAKTVNRLVFRIFLPAMLFLNVYEIDSIEGIDPGYIIYGASAILVIFLLGIPAVIFATKNNGRRGPLLQGIFRSNYALIGIPLAKSLLGSGGLGCAAVLSAVSIPLFNILAVVSLSLFGDRKERPSIKKIVLDILKNPLIQAIAAGLFTLLLRNLFLENGISFRLSQLRPIFAVLGYLSDLATPLALLSLGIQFSFTAATSMKKELTFGVLMRTVAVPLLVLGIACIFFDERFSKAEFAALVALFSTPVAVSSVPMAQEMGADAELAGQMVIWTTPVSALTVFVAVFLLRTMSIL